MNIDRCKPYTYVYLYRNETFTRQKISLINQDKVLYSDEVIIITLYGKASIYIYSDNEIILTENIKLIIEVAKIK